MWLNIAAKLVPGMIKTGMKIATNRRKAKELESIAEMNHAQRMADGQIEYQKAVRASNDQGIKDEIVPYFLAKKLFKAAPEPKRFYDIEGAGHNDTYHAGGRDYFKSIETFIDQISPAVSRKDTINQDNEIISR